MSAAVSIPWPSILSDASASLNGKTSAFSINKLPMRRCQDNMRSEFWCFDPTAKASKSTSDLFKLDQDVPRSSLNTQEKRLPNVADWKGTLDFVTSMTGVAGDQRNHLREQTEAQQRALEDVRRELNETRQRLQEWAQRAHELQVQADSRLQKIQARLDLQVEKIRIEAETRVRVICARNADLIRVTKKRVRAAELRAQTANEWLQRIDSAAKNLRLHDSMIR